MPMPMAYAQPHAYPPQGHRAPQQQPAYHPQMASVTRSSYALAVYVVYVFQRL
jgi:hypothetical protein